MKLKTAVIGTTLLILTLLSVAVEAGQIGGIKRRLSSPGSKPSRSGTSYRRTRDEMNRDWERDRKRRKAEWDRERKAEKRKRELEKKKKQQQTKAVSQPAPRRPSFNPGQAPAPEICLRNFIETTLAAESLDEIATFLPSRKLKSLTKEQAKYDLAEAAAERQSWLEKDPDMTDESLEYITQSPHERELNRIKRFARRVVQLGNPQAAGNRATVVVSVTREGDTIDGGEHGFGTAKVELLGEKDYWRFYGFSESDIFHEEPPRIR